MCICHQSVGHHSANGTYHPINREKLVASLQTTVSVSDASRDDP